ncbi:MAG: dihydrodipicolinate synthase family protein [Deltaproteobacteria bacterium]|nr:dihydrodipicolinate synthase family protein [Deltaproteobacteria bacterium]
MNYRKGEAKEWAKGFYRGLDGTILPSFTPETLELDEAGIRHDVRELIRHGFFSISLVTEAGTTKEEDKKFLEWCVDEAKGRIGITFALKYYSVAENIDMARFAEAAGADSLLLSYGSNFHPRSPEEVYEYSRAICDATNLAVVLFPSIKDDFPFPGRIPAPVLKRLADLDNVVAMKIGILEWGWIDECFRLFGDKVLISYPLDDAWPTFIRKYGMQWSGSSPWQFFQTPDDRRQVRLFHLFQEGRMDEAMELYWQLDPLRKTILQITLPTAAMGLYNFQQWKYCEELVGMTGGELRHPKLTLFWYDRERLRQAMLATGMKLAK